MKVPEKTPSFFLFVSLLVPFVSLLVPFVSLLVLFVSLSTKPFTSKAPYAPPAILQHCLHTSFHDAGEECNH